MIDAYLTQDITWRPARRRDDGTAITGGDGRTQYEAEQTVKGFILEKFRTVKDSQGQERVSSSEGIVKVEVHPEDYLNGREVIAVNTLMGFGGLTAGRRVYLA